MCSFMCQLTPPYFLTVHVRFQLQARFNLIFFASGISILAVLCAQFYSPRPLVASFIAQSVEQIEFSFFV